MNDHSPQPIVFVRGCFDDLKTIDIRFTQEAAKLGDVHALLFSDHASQAILKKETKYPLNERRYYLENIRYVNQLSIVDNTDHNTIPLSIALAEGSNRKLIWAVRESDASRDKEIFCEQNGILYQVITDKALSRFPPHTSSVNELNGKRKVMVSGCFDWVHSGHVRFFEEASQFGELYVVVGHDSNLFLLKGEGHPMFSQEERRYWVGSIKFVTRAMISSGDGWLDAKPEIERIKPDVFIVNKDGDKPEKQELFKKLNIEYKVLERKPKPGLSARISTDLRGF